MKKFSFNLESILKIRERETKEKLAEFAAVQSRVNVFYQANIKMQEEYVIEEDIYLENMKSNFRAEEGRVFDRYIKRIAEQSRQNNLEIEKLQPLLIQARQIYEEAYRKKRAVEMLKEKKLEEHKREIIKEEQDESDEISTGILANVYYEQEKRKQRLQDVAKDKKKSNKEDNLVGEDELIKEDDEVLVELFESLKKTSAANSFEGFKKKFNL